jgi:hypothetical protein
MRRARPAASERRDAAAMASRTRRFAARPRDVGVEARVVGPV